MPFDMTHARPLPPERPAAPGPRTVLRAFLARLLAADTAVRQSAALDRTLSDPHLARDIGLVPRARSDRDRAIDRLHAASLPF